MEVKSPITLGMDPEIGYLDKTGHQVMASSFLNNCSYGVGLDGHSDISEIRLKSPASTPKAMVEEVRKYLKELKPKLAKGVKVVAGECVSDDPLGGHIHHGKTKYTRSNDLAIYGDRLDLYLAIPTLMLENTAGAKKRRGSSYGKLYAERPSSAIEVKGYGGFEYRTLSSYLTSPSFTESIIALSHTVVHEIDYGTTRLRSFKNFKEASMMISKFNSCDKSYFDKYLKGIFEDIKHCTLYKHNYRLLLNGLFGLIFAFRKDDKDWKSKDDIMVRWGLSTEEAEEPKKEEAKKVVVVAEGTTVTRNTISGNAGDYNMGDLLRALSDINFSIGIHLYGVRDDHEIDIGYYYTQSCATIPNTDLVSTRSMGGARMDGFRVINERLSDSRSNGTSLTLGLSKRLRQNIPLCKQILLNLLASYRLPSA